VIFAIVWDAVDCLRNKGCNDSPACASVFFCEIERAERRFLYQCVLLLMLVHSIVLEYSETFLGPCKGS